MYQSKIRQKKNRANQKNKMLILPEEGQEYAVVKDMLGNGRLRATCEDGSERIGRIRGSMRKYATKVIIDRGDLILVSTRDFGNDDKVDVFHKYSHDDISALLKMGELPERIFKALTLHDEQNYGKGGANDDYVVFMNEDDDKDEDIETESKHAHDEELKTDDEGESDIDIDAI